MIFNENKNTKATPFQTNMRTPNTHKNNKTSPQITTYYHTKAHLIKKKIIIKNKKSTHLERLFHLRLRGTTANVQKVGRLATVQLNNVHRRHGQPSAIDKASVVGDC